MKGSKTCELCSGEAALYCMSDSAFLCWSCDVQVHQANFLVARHVRRTICSKCKEFDGNHLSGVGFRPCPSFCQSCSNDGIMSSDNDYGDDDNLSSSSTCISSAESVVVKKITTRRVSAKVSSSVSDISGESLSGNSLKEKNSITKNANKRVVLAKGILVNWCRNLSTNNNVSSIHKIASHAFSTCLRELTYLPYRVSLATSMWLALKFCGASTCQDLKRVQDVSGVPMKLILIGEKKMGRVLKMNGSDRIDLEEGWAECDD